MPSRLHIVSVHRRFLDCIMAVNADDARGVHANGFVGRDVDFACLLVSGLSLGLHIGRPHALRMLRHRAVHAGKYLV